MLLIPDETIMSDTRIGFGLLGAGLIAPFHAKALRASPVRNCVAASDMAADRLTEFAGEFGCQAYATLEEMLADPRDPGRQRPDAQPPALRRRGESRRGRQARAGGEAAGHVAGRSERDDRGGAKAGVKIGVVLQCRTRKAMQAMRGAICAGRFGKTPHADTYMKWFRPAEYYQMDAWRGRGAPARA